MGVSIYALKPRFQNLLRPLVRRLHAAGVTANAVTISACVVSCAVGIVVWQWAALRWVFVLVPVWMLLRMAFNAMDGMLAREFGQQSALGGFLNEITDVIADAALILPFAALPGFAPGAVVAVCLAAWLTEFAGVVAVAVGAARRYDGPMGKSDRAFVFGSVGLFAAFGFSFERWGVWVLAALLALLAWTTVNRVRGALMATMKSSS
jgi:CDP-diacylglycerol---glycerol-3-phosphate 3-phosphatidyltransferase